MAAGFDLTAVARRLLNIEVNTIVRESMTGEPMPPLPHALLDIATEYAQELCRIGVDLRQYFASPATEPETIKPAWVASAAPVSDLLTLSADTFDRLRWAAKWALGAAASRPPRNAAISPALLARIVNNADAIKQMFDRFDKSFKDQFGGKNRDGLLTDGVRPGSYAVATDDLITVQKIWDIGLEEIVAQTIVHVTGDVTTRVQPGLYSPGSETLFAIHRQSIDVSVNCWKALLDAVREIAGTAVGALLGR